MRNILAKVCKAAWKAALVFIGLWAMLKVCHQICYWFGRASWNDKTVSSDVVVRVYRNSTCRVYNKKTGRYTTPKLRWVAGTPKRDSLTVFCDKSGYRGFLNVNTGEIALPAQYGKAWQFSEGLAAVEYGKKQLGFINYAGEMVMEDIPHESGFFDYLFKDGFCTVLYWDDKTDGRVYSVYSSKTLGKVGEYSDISYLDRGEYMIACDDTGYWLLDSEYKRVFDGPYEDIEEASDIGVFVTRDYVKQHIDFDGTVLEPFVIDGTERLQYVTGLTEAIPEYDQDQVMELEPELMTYRVNYCWGLMNARTGKIITPAKYGYIRMVSRDLLRADINYADNESILLDRNGKEISE